MGGYGQTGDPFPFFPLQVAEGTKEDYRIKAFCAQRDEALRKAADAESELQMFKWGPVDAIAAHLSERFDCQVTILVCRDPIQRIQEEYAKNGNPL